MVLVMPPRELALNSQWQAFRYITLSILKKMRRTFSVFIASAFLLLLSCSSTRKNINSHSPITATDKVWNEANIADFENKIESLCKRYHIPGLSVGIVNEKKLKWKKGFGYANIESKTIPDENTVYHIASVTKTFASILLMQQVENKKVSLDDPILKYGINLGARWGSD
jgi:CubicO group peptidase (beta-lactamase class C family)